ncbi:MAG TPA: hypothetical protein VNY51_09300 [Candidatus Dormibacteraeota bacterium]|jgi:hypothetical protein|nr:hypothetical protein [Candidatus Dormibacteraeota bacterium]
MAIHNVLLLVISIILQVCILVLLLKRQLQRRFTWFFVYTIYSLLELIVRLVVSGHYETYFIVYWSTEPVGVAFTVLALRESFLYIFWPEARWPWFRWVFWCGFGLAIGYSCWLASALPSREPGHLAPMFIHVEFALDIVISVFGLLYAGCIRLFGILEHQRESAIILGFTAIACLGNFGWLTRSVFGTRFKLLTQLVVAVAYIVGELIWTRDLLRPEWKLPQPTQTLEEMVETMSRSVAILQKYLGRES